MNMDPATTLHDIRWGKEYSRNGIDEFVWVLEISGAVPPSHLINGFARAVSERQPAMYFLKGRDNQRGKQTGRNCVESRLCDGGETSLRYRQGYGRKLASRGDENPLGVHNSAMTDHERHFAWR